MDVHSALEYLNEQLCYSFKYSSDELLLIIIDLMNNSLDYSKINERSIEYGVKYNKIRDNLMNDNRMLLISYVALYDNSELMPIIKEKLCKVINDIYNDD